MDSLVSTQWLADQLGAADLVVLDASMHLPDSPRQAAQDFAAAHQDVCLLYSRGALEPRAFEQHMQRLPLPVRKSLKWFSRRWNVLPPNIAVLLDQVSMICAEGEVFWASHGC